MLGGHGGQRGDQGGAGTEGMHHLFEDYAVAARSTSLWASMPACTGAAGGERAKGPQERLTQPLLRHGELGCAQFVKIVHHGLFDPEVIDPDFVEQDDLLDGEFSTGSYDDLCGIAGVGMARAARIPVRASFMMIRLMQHLHWKSGLLIPCLINLRFVAERGKIFGNSAENGVTAFPDSRGGAFWDTFADGFGTLGKKLDIGPCRRFALFGLAVRRRLPLGGGMADFRNRGREAAQSRIDLVKMP